MAFMMPSLSRSMQGVCQKPVNYPIHTALSRLRSIPTYRGAALDVEAADGLAVVHGVEGGDLVNTHGRHLEEASDLVHDANAGEAVLALAQIEQRHDGGLLVLAGVAGEDLLDELLILLVELEGYRGIVLGSVSVLQAEVASARWHWASGYRWKCGGQRVRETYNGERVARGARGGGEGAPLGLASPPDGTEARSQGERGQLGGHGCGVGECRASVQSIYFDVLDSSLGVSGRRADSQSHAGRTKQL